MSSTAESRAAASDLTGRVVVVTGGARGIGAATARMFADSGAAVAIGDVDAHALARAGDAWCSHSRVLDVTDSREFAGFVAAVESALGPIDIMVNNAGIMPTGWFRDEAADVSTRVIEINLLGVIHGTKLALDSMLPRRRGHIVNLASIAGASYGPGAATYCASKSGVVAFTDSIRCELRGSGVSISPILPMMVETDMIAGARILRFARPVTPDAVARAIVDSARRPRARVYVPRSGAVMAGLARVLPPKLNDLVTRAAGLDQVFLADVDLEARERYLTRVRRDRADHESTSEASRAQ